jgi:geranylgeranyl transferase type-2 subunit alpha
LDLTKQLLAVNPELYTIWNYRRNILVNGIFPNRRAYATLTEILDYSQPLSRTPSEIHDLLSADLSQTIIALRQYPKVYWIWNHRRWCLEHVPDDPDEVRDGWRNANWAKELYFVEKMLDADSRNCKA